MIPLLFLLAAAGAQAGVIQGVVLEYASGRPVARSVVRLQPVPRANAESVAPFTTRVARSGMFLFNRVPPGLYILTSTRDNYHPAHYGQRLPAGRGRPVEVTADSSLFAELRLRHKGAITGRVLDENGVAAAGVPVVAYRARLPLRSARTGTSDDRGVYRIHGLEPGKYWVRSAPHVLEDAAGWLPTFSPFSRELNQARVYTVAVDTETAYADVNPEGGFLFGISGNVTCDSPLPVIVSLSSETEQKRIQTNCGGSYRFDGLAPGPHELLGVTQDGGYAAYFDLMLNRPTDGPTLPLTRVPGVQIEVVRAGSTARVDAPVTLVGRRQSVADADPPAVIKGPRTTLAPGIWEMRAQAPAGYYVHSIAGVWSAGRRIWKTDRPAEWFEVFIEPRTASLIRIELADGGAQLSGRVTTDGKPVPGAPVFLWPVEERARRSVGGFVETLSDTEGRYKFQSLPPGPYRILATFDADEVDPDVLEQSQAQTLKLEASRAVELDVKTWIAPY